MSPVLCFLLLHSLLLSLFLGIQLSSLLLFLQRRSLAQLPVEESQCRTWSLLLIPPLFFIFFTAHHLLAAAGHVQQEGEKFISLHCPELAEHCDLFLDWQAPEALVYGLGALLTFAFLLSRLPTSPNFKTCTNHPSEAPASPEHTKYLHELREEIQFQYSLRLPPLRLNCDLQRTAFVTGLLFQTIHIPLRLLHALSSQELKAVILHEWAHTRRKDNLRAFFLELCSRLSCFPNTWRGLKHQVRIDRELLCDKMAVQYGRAPLELGSALLKVSRMMQQIPSPHSTVCHLVTPEQALLEARVQRLLEYADHQPLPSRTTPFSWQAFFLAGFLPWLGSPWETTLLSLHCWPEEILHGLGF